VWAANVEGRIEWNTVCPSKFFLSECVFYPMKIYLEGPNNLTLCFVGMADLKPHTRVVLDGGVYYAGVRRSGEFTM
jgi:hypothetical protein